MTAFGTALVALGACYAAAISAFAFGFWRVTRRTRATVSDVQPFVSVIIPARDESRCIEACLESVFANEYPAELFEVLVVDDLSLDDTPNVVQEQMGRVGSARLRLLRMPENLHRTKAHKKRAIEKGIAEARGEIILTTDADCFVPKGWISTMAGQFHDVRDDPTVEAVTAFVSGPVVYRPKDHPLLHMQALEFLGLVAAGAGAIGAGRPMICNGANVAYRKDVFDALGGFSGIDHLTSGDDELLMQKINDTTRHRVRFCASPHATVLTDPVYSFREFFQQRKRWASKGAHYPNPFIVGILVAIYLFYVGLLAGAVALPFVAGAWMPLLVALALKIVPEAALLLQACVHFGRLRLFVYFLPEQLLHIPYIVILAAAGALGKYEWKGRQVAR